MASSGDKENSLRFLVGLTVMAVIFAILLPVTLFALYDLHIYRDAAKREFKELRTLRKEVKQELERLRGKPPVDEAGEPMPERSGS
jgi:flagellar biosynthesis protein FlhB